MKRIISYTLVLLLPIFTWAQNHSDCGVMSEKPTVTDSVSNLKEFFYQGYHGGHIRNFTMTTVNHGELKDYWTNATGGALAYHTARWHGFQFGVKGIFTYKTASANLNEKDPLTGKSAKWEKELYDVTDPYNHHDLDRLEELFIHYERKEFFVEIGKIDINETPLVNRRDGRMKPFVFRGIFGEANLFTSHKLTLAIIDGVSPRAMTEWYGLHEAIGLNNNGYNPDGIKTDYHEHAHIRGMVFAGYKLPLFKKSNLTSWYYHIDNLIHLFWTEVKWNSENLFGGMQYIHERADHYQKHLPSANRYYQPDEKANVISSRIGWKNKDWKVSGNFTHAFNTGRFIFPRELGRERFYTSIPRSWFEGLGAGEAATIMATFTPHSTSLKTLTTDLRITRVQPFGLTWNKYQLQSYNQLNASVIYDFHNVLNGLEFQLLYICKWDFDNNYSAVSEFNKMNFHQINFITNIKF